MREVRFGDTAASSVLSHLFAKGALECADAADANDDGTLNIADPIRLLAYLFARGDPLPAPFGACGLDGTTDSLPECIYPRCRL